MMKKFLFGLIILFLIGAPLSIQANGVEGINIEPPTEGGFTELILRLISFFIYLSVIGAVFAIIYGGFTYMTARGEPQKIQKANKIITYAIVGLILAVSSYAIVKFFMTTVLGVEIGF